MGSYRIIASDLDGTLLNNTSEVSSENLSAITALAEQGVYFAPSSGRTLMEMPENIREHPSLRYISHSNGAVLLDRKTGKRCLNCISQEQAALVWKLIENLEVHIAVRWNGNCYTDARFHTKEAHAYFRVAPIQSKVVFDFGIPTDNFSAFLESLQDIEVIALSFRNAEDLAACNAFLAKAGGFLTAEPCERLLEIFNENAGKGNTLLQLADMIHVDRAATIGVGDSDNDMTMIQAAGLGLAVANATPELKAAADEIICSNEEHILPYILTNYCEGK